MKAVFRTIWELAKPYLETRDNNTHTRISIEYAYDLLRKEGGDQDIVIPAIILHDVGWSKIPAHLHSKSFGPKATHPELNRLHEIEGAKIAEYILEKVGYDPTQVQQISRIIQSHDSSSEPFNLNDKLVKDADRLFRYSKEGIHLCMELFCLTYQEELNRVRSNLEIWLFTTSAKKIARERIKDLEKTEEHLQECRSGGKMNKSTADPEE
jgi:HD superfamily phosphodiesterase